MPCTAASTSVTCRAGISRTCRSAIAPAQSVRSRRSCREIPGCARSACGAEVLRGELAGAAVLRDLEIDLLAFGQAVHARTLDRGDMDEHVRSAGVRLDEAEALLVVEPLHCSSCHFCLPVVFATVWPFGPVVSRFWR